MKLANAEAFGYDAMARGDWAAAREHLSAAPPTPQVLEAVSWAEFWLGDEAATLAARESAYRAHREAGDDCGAARMAIWLASDLLDFRGEDASATGWLQRARRLIGEREACPEQGWLLLMEADVLLRTGSDPGEVQLLAVAAAQLARELGDVDVEVVGLGMEGWALVAQGEVEAGMRRLDEAAAAAAAERFQHPISAGWALCYVVGGCEGVGDIPRGQQRARLMYALAKSWGARNLMGVCRAAFGGLLTASGQWEAAEAELVAAVDDLAATRPAMAVSGYVRLADLRTRQGRRDEARELFAKAGGHPQATLGLGRLALRDGDPQSAADAAERVLRNLNRGAVLERIPALELAVEAFAALGRGEDVEAHVGALDAAARQIGTPYLVGRAHLAAARAAHDADVARRRAEDAIDCLTRSSAPYEAAHARVALARALHELGRTAAAEQEIELASAAFRALGAAHDLDDLDGVGAPTVASALSARELDVLRLVAGGLSDAEIAERLIVSPHTVHRHVANIRAKLRLPSRAAAVAYAAREGLL